jgi:arylsulfatase A-like enzyme
MKPNILLVLPDQLRGDWIEPISTAPVRTPNVLALNDLGTNFTNTWTPSPICASARACIATGRNYDRSPVQHNNENMPLNGDTFYRRLADAGYDVVTAGKIDLLKGYMDWGDDGRHMAGGESRLLALGFTGGVDSAGKHDALRGRERGASEPYMNYLAGLGLDQIHFEDYKRREPGEFWKTIAETTRTYLPPPAAYANTDLSPLPEEAYCDNWIGSNALSELERLLRQDDPWFLTVNFAGPHEPLDVTSAMRERWKDVVFPPPYARVGDDHSLQQTIRQNYASMIELIDTWLGRYMRVLEEAGVLSDTLVVFASDHGEMLGDYNFWGKAVPFEPSIRVPLIIAGPECRNRGAVYEGPVPPAVSGATQSSWPALFSCFGSLHLSGISAWTFSVLPSCRNLYCGYWRDWPRSILRCFSGTGWGRGKLLPLQTMTIPSFKSQSCVRARSLPLAPLPPISPCFRPERSISSSLRYFSSRSRELSPGREQNCRYCCFSAFPSPTRWQPVCCSATYSS